jgi:hypothetical protein
MTVTVTPSLDQWFVFQNNTGDENQWTTTPWNTFGGADIAFKVATSP